MQNNGPFQRIERHVVELFEARRQAANAAGEDFVSAPYTEERFRSDATLCSRLSSIRFAAHLSPAHRSK